MHNLNIIIKHESYDVEAVLSGTSYTQSFSSSQAHVFVKLQGQWKLSTR